MTFMGLKGLFSTYAEGMAQRTRMFATNISNNAVTGGSRGSRGSNEVEYEHKTAFFLRTTPSAFDHHQCKPPSNLYFLDFLLFSNCVFQDGQQRAGSRPTSFPCA